jgi:hypothetical protein
VNTPPTLTELNVTLERTCRQTTKQQQQQQQQRVQQQQYIVVAILNLIPNQAATRADPSDSDNSAFYNHDRSGINVQRIVAAVVVTTQTKHPIPTTAASTQ